VWLVQAVSLLCAASYTEDHAGVVLESLQDVFSALLATQITIEEYVRSPRFACAEEQRQLAGQQIMRPECHALSIALDNAVYRLVGTFYEHLSMLSFAPVYAARLQAFVNFEK
jgi:hypothetical protein